MGVEDYTFDDERLPVTAAFMRDVKAVISPGLDTTAVAGLIIAVQHAVARLEALVREAEIAAGITPVERIESTLEPLAGDED